MEVVRTKRKRVSLNRNTLFSGNEKDTLLNNGLQWLLLDFSWTLVFNVH